jgi:hypothetical protein
VLALNGGSSSIRFAIYACVSERFAALRPGRRGTSSVARLMTNASSWSVSPSQLGNRITAPAGRSRGESSSARHRWRFAIDGGSLTVALPRRPVGSIASGHRLSLSASGNCCAPDRKGSTSVRRSAYAPSCDRICDHQYGRTGFAVRLRHCFDARSVATLLSDRFARPRVATLRLLR